MHFLAMILPASPVPLGDDEPIVLPFDNEVCIYGDTKVLIIHLRDILNVDPYGYEGGFVLLGKLKFHVIHRDTNLQDFPLRATMVVYASSKAYE